MSKTISHSRIPSTRHWRVLPISSGQALTSYAICEIPVNRKDTYGKIMLISS